METQQQISFDVLKKYGFKMGRSCCNENRF